jgi:hypothetical protein
MEGGGGDPFGVELCILPTRVHNLWKINKKIIRLRVLWRGRKIHLELSSAYCRQASTILGKIEINRNAEGAVEGEDDPFEVELRILPTRVHNLRIK